MRKICLILFFGLFRLPVASADDVGTTPSVAAPPMDALRIERPRLLLTPERVAALRDGMLAEEPAASWFEAVQRTGSELLETPVVQYPPRDRDMLDQSRQVRRRVITLGFLHLMTGDDRYRDRLWRDLEAAAKLDSWRPDIQFLATAEMLQAFAIAYDWLFDAWTPEQRRTLERAIRNNGLQAGRDAYDGKITSFAGWDAANNWNFVCNGALITGATALLPKDGEFCATLIGDAFTRLPRAVADYGIDGGYIEGITYWGYGTSYFASLIACLDSAFGNNGGLKHLNPGFAVTGFFPIYLAGPGGMPFDFADSEFSPVRSSDLFLLAAWFDQPRFARFQLDHAGDKGGVGDIIGWLLARKTLADNPKLPPLPLDRFFSGVGVGSMRSGWDDPNANWVALRAGGRKSDHGHLDQGSFIFEALGHRWIHELDKESYAVPGYFSTSVAGQRWTYYRVRAEGHNTLVINPSGKPKADQYPNAKVKLLAFESTPGDAFAVFDLTDGYLPDATRVVRGIRLADSRNRLFVRDEIRLQKPGEIVWAVHVHDPVTLSADRRTASMVHEGRQLTLRLEEPEGAAFEVMDAKPLADIPDTKQSDNPGVRKIVIRLSDVTETAIAVSFTPSLVGFELPTEMPEILGPLAEWKPRELAGADAVTGLALDGLPLAVFASDQFTYTVERPDPAATLTASPEGSATVTDSGQDSLPQIFYARTKTGNDETSPLYRVVVKKEVLPPATLAPLPGPRPVKVVAPFQSPHGAVNAFDGLLATRWSAEGRDVLMKITLPEVREVEGVALAFMSGDKRSSKFSVEVSEDGVEFFPLLTDAASSGRTEKPEIFRATTPRRAKYLRFHGQGNNVNDWNSILEIVVLPVDEE